MGHHQIHRRTPEMLRLHTELNFVQPVVYVKNADVGVLCINLPHHHQLPRPTQYAVNLHPYLPWSWDPFDIVCFPGAHPTGVTWSSVQLRINAAIKELFAVAVAAASMPSGSLGDPLGLGARLDGHGGGMHTGVSSVDVFGIDVMLGEDMQPYILEVRLKQGASKLAPFLAF